MGCFYEMEERERIMKMFFESIKIKWAKRIMRGALKGECYKRDKYRKDIALCIYNNRRKDGRLNILNCQEVAEKLIKVIFD